MFEFYSSVLIFENNFSGEVRTSNKVTSFRKWDKGKNNFLNRAIFFLADSNIVVIHVCAFYSCFRAPALESHHQVDWPFSGTG